MNTRQQQKATRSPGGRLALQAMHEFCRKPYGDDIALDDIARLVNLSRSDHPLQRSSLATIVRAMGFSVVRGKRAILWIRPNMELLAELEFDRLSLACKSVVLTETEYAAIRAAFRDATAAKCTCSRYMRPGRRHSRTCPRFSMVPRAEALAAILRRAVRVGDSADHVENRR